MNNDVHTIPAGTFAALAEGGGGQAGALCLVGAQASKHMLLLRRIVDLARSAGHEEAAAAKRAYDQLAAVQEDQPDAVAGVVRHPAVGAWARQMIDDNQSARARSRARPEWMAAVAAAATIRARIPWSAIVPVEDGAAMLPSLGSARATAGQLRVGCDGAEIDRARLPDDLGLDEGNWHGLRRLSAAADDRRLELLIDDLDPHRAPGMDNAGERLTAAEVATWQSVLDGAWELLVRHHAAVAQELVAMIRVLTPLRPPPGGHVSATSRHTFGAIMLSAPLDACSLAVTLAHEVQHAKLSALMDLVPMTRKDDGRRFYAPWREDPRPASGLLQGAYAFLGVAGFWRVQSRLPDGVQALTEFVRWLAAVRLVIDTLSVSGTLTGPGEVFVSGIDRTLRRWEAEPVPGQVLAAAQRANNEHRERWSKVNGEMLPRIGVAGPASGV
jgi:HEXXH motif-containing protein